MATRITSPPGLLEREDELRRLQRAIERACDGTGGLVSVHGPAGVGKTRLLARARSQAGAAGMRVLEARGAPLEATYAFGVARQLFEAPVLAAPDDERAALLSGAARLSERLFGEAGPPLEAEGGEAAFGALHGLHWLTVNLADRGPLMLAVDDAQWADAPSLRFLSYLAGRLDGLPVVLVAAGRMPDPEAASPLWRQLAEDESGLALRLRPLSEQATADLVRASLAGADDEFCRACHGATGGNPLFLRELLAALEQAEIEPTAATAPAVTTVGAPAVVRFVLHRLERLGPEATAFAQALAVLGDAADTRLAAEAAGLDQAAAAALGDRLVEADVLAPSQPPAFAHPIVRAAVYENLLPGERAARHAAAAALLAEAGAPPERVAAHLLEATPAGDPERVTVLRSAAARAAERGAPGAAATFLRRALAEPPPVEARGELVGDLGRWELARQEFGGAEQHLLDALATPADPAVHVRAGSWLARCAVATGRSAAAAAALEQLLADLEHSDRDRTLEVEAELVNLHMSQMPLRRLLPERLERFGRRAAGDARFERVATVYAAVERSVRAESADAIADDIEAALAQGPLASLPANFVAIMTLRQTGRYDTAARWLELALQAARAQGLSGQLAIVHGERAWLALARGAVADAALEAELGLELIGAGHFMLPRLAAAATEAAIERGDLAAAAEAVRRGTAEGEHERLFLDELLTARGKLDSARGEPRQALADLLRVGELHESYGVRRPDDWRPHAALALAALGESGRAEELAREQLERTRAFGVPRALGLALRAAGSVIGGAEGLALLEQAVATLEPSPARLELAHARAALGAELVRRRRRTDGREQLRAAVEAALACGATALAERARGELGAGGGRRARLELSGVSALTPAERRVCELAAGDATNREIAQTLFVTEKTVELHLTSAYRKLAIRSRFQLAGALASDEA
jgi:DNA-binding CsgD family transcriptional regulator/tetratricopeptide (TPR) repeat protein